MEFSLVESLIEMAFGSKSFVLYYFYCTYEANYKSKVWVSLCICGKVVPGVPTNTKINRCPNLL
jgi:hypothetical protein